jgi:hypothetical protein
LKTKIRVKLRVWELSEGPRLPARDFLIEDTGWKPVLQNSSQAPRMRTAKPMRTTLIFPLRVPSCPFVDKRIYAGD